MKETLTIKNFGPIKDVTLELKRFNVLIGEQATGKSTIVKLLAVCRYFSYIADTSFLSDNPFETGLIAWGMEESIQENTFIRYVCKHYSFTAERAVRKVIERDEEEVIVMDYDEQYFSCSLEPVSADFKNLWNEFEQLKSSVFDPGVNNYGFSSWVPTSFYQNDVSKVMDNPFFLPTERGLQSIFSLGKESIRNISDSLFNQLAEIDRIARFYKEETNIEPLNITYVNKNGYGRIRKKSDKNFYSLANGASGFQSTIPVVLAIKNYSEVRKRKKTFIVEEPEMNLFPSAQHKLVEYIVDKVMNSNNQVLLTTHSPYILTSVNNLVYAYKIGKTKRVDTQKIISENHWLNGDEVSAYILLPDGTCEDVFNRQEGLIEAERIDLISRRINDDFDKLLHIEFDEQ